MRTLPMRVDVQKKASLSTLEVAKVTLRRDYPVWGGLVWAPLIAFAVGFWVWIFFLLT